MRCFLIFFLSCFLLEAQDTLPSATTYSSLVDPYKCSTLGKRGANQRVLKILGRMAQFEKNGIPPKMFLKKIYAPHKGIKPYYSSKHVYSPLSEQRMLLKNFEKLKKWDCVDDFSINNLIKGKSIQIKKGLHKGQVIHVDHIFPVSKEKNLGNAISNLELLPSKINILKSDKIVPEAVKHTQKIFNDINKNKLLPRHLKLTKTPRFFSNGKIVNYATKRLKKLTPISRISSHLFVGAELILESYLTYSSYLDLQSGEIKTEEFFVLTAIRASRAGVGFVAVFNPELISKGAAVVTYLALTVAEYGVESYAKIVFEDRNAILEICGKEQKYSFLRHQILKYFSHK